MPDAAAHTEPCRHSTHIRVRRAGRPLPDDAVGSTVPVFALFGVGRLDLPGGAWSCDMAMGGAQAATTETQVEGPTEAYSQAMSCDSKDVYTYEETGVVAASGTHPCRAHPARW